MRWFQARKGRSRDLFQSVSPRIERPPCYVPIFFSVSLSHTHGRGSHHSRPALLAPARAAVRSVHPVWERRPHAAETLPSDLLKPTQNNRMRQVREPRHGVRVAVTPQRGSPLALPHVSLFSSLPSTPRQPTFPPRLETGLFYGCRAF